VMTILINWRRLQRSHTCMLRYVVDLGQGRGLIRILGRAHNNLVHCQGFLTL
jgi:hypothetical protein